MTLATGVPLNKKYFTKPRRKWIPILTFIAGGSIVIFLQILHSNLHGAVSGRDVSGSQHFKIIDIDPAHSQTKSETREASPPQIRIFCFIKTQPKNHATRVKAVKETWAKRCDRYIFISSKSDPHIPSINIFHSIKNESRSLLTQKVFSALTFVSQNYLNEYDWFHEADDDTYLVIDNIRAFLSTKDPQKPEYFGQKFAMYLPSGYTGGGAGYVMSKEALRRFRDHGPDTKACNTNGTASDLHVGTCLSALGVILGNSLDSLGRSRYHSFDVEPFVNGGFPNWYHKYLSKSGGSRVNWIADYPMSFHYINYRKMYVLDILLYQTKVKGESRWPKPSFN